MSVLSCSKNGCDNVMCDRYSHTFGYICDECFARLSDMKLTNVNDIEKFLKSYEPIVREDICIDLENEFPIQR